jgi:hypothetical protein
MNIEETVLEIRNILSKRQKEFKLTFEEDTHKYTMLNLDGKLHSKCPSVSKVMKLFYDEFPSEKKAFEMSGGDPDETERLLAEWAGKCLVNKVNKHGESRVHYLLGRAHSLERV